MRAMTAQSVTEMSSNPLHLIVVIVLCLVVLAYFGIFIVTLVSVLRAPLDTGMKIVWVVLVFTASLLGILLWWVVGRRDAASRSSYEGAASR